MGKILGIDWGEKNIGLAISDELKIIASPLLVLKNDEKIFENLKKICEKENVEKIIIGLPQTLRGEWGKQAQRVLDFSQKCYQKIKIPIEFEDERFTSHFGKILINEHKTKKTKKKDFKNLIESHLILQSYLERLNYKKQKNDKNF